MKKQKKAWFQVLLAVGAALGLLMLFEAVSSYRNVVGDLVMDHIKSQAGVIASAVESRVSGPAFPSAEELRRPTIRRGRSSAKNASCVRCSLLITDLPLRSAAVYSPK